MRLKFEGRRMVLTKIEMYGLTNATMTAQRDGDSVISVCLNQSTTF